MPTGWQYEWSEAFLHVLGNEELVFSDHEIRKKKTEYSHLGGCYYSCKMAVLEALAREQKQAGAIILREALHGYVPMGVFNVRENVRSAMLQPGQEFEDIKSALSHISQKFTLPMNRFVEEGHSSGMSSGRNRPGLRISLRLPRHSVYFLSEERTKI
jgi:hypothetical protein